MAASSSAPSRPADRAAAVCLVARDAREREAHFAVRHAVFVHAQRLFAGSDRDGRDDDARTLHAIALVGDRVAGAVRLYPLDAAGLWKGDRLAVLEAERVGRLGAMLVRFAVRTAGELGGERMVARIQLPNVGFFARLGWERDGDPAPMLGVVHQPMTIGL